MIRHIGLWKTTRHSLESLRQLVRGHAEQRRKGLREEFAREYKETVERIRRMRFGIHERVFDNFRLLEREKGRFWNLNKGIDEKYKQEREMLRNELERMARTSFSEPKKLHIAFWYLGYLKRYDETFSEDAFAGFFFGELSEQFRYHFLSDRESNRLDKPEWFFEFLAERVAEFSKIFALFGKPLGDLFRRSEELVSKKATELEKCKSRQKRALVHHFVDETLLFSDHLGKKYAFQCENVRVRALLAKTEDENARKEMRRIHQMDYTSWWAEYKTVLRDSMHVYGRFGSFERDASMHSHIS